MVSETTTLVIYVYVYRLISLDTLFKDVWKQYDDLW